MVQVKVSEGILEGEELDNEYGGKIYSFKGIPYAQPPLRDLRFKAPQPLQPWKGVRSAKEYGPVCYQYEMFLKKGPFGSEDCLYLNVYSPNLKPDKPLPVMIWIHGGAFLCGSGNDEMYGPEFLIEHDVIVVTINYRLEVLGFLCLDTEDAPGNAGMKDQVAALRWVKRNISNFGGDSENITIFGESAGGASVSFHLISPMSKGLFKRAIAQSGVATNSWTMPIEPRERARALARKLGLESNDDRELYEFFKSQPVESLILASVPITLSDEINARVNLHYGIVNEKQFGNNERFFYGDVYDVLRNGIHEGVEVMAGYCADEGYLGLLAEDKEKLFAQYQSYLETFAPHEIALNCSLKDTFEAGRKMKQFYLKGKEVSKETVGHLADFISMYMFVYGIVQWQKISSIKNKTYLYKFTCKSERNWLGVAMGISDILKDKTITAHADDLAYIFTVKELQQKIEKGSETYKLINNVTTLWTNFAKFGNPTPDSTLGVKWQPYSVTDQDYLDIGNVLVPSRKPDDEQIQFWENIFKKFYPHCVA